ncbi:uncharacterized protein LOC131040795 [Cryptomeria japonica]|uniref:uncharacterized protein LOC131040795 n=1 Tax=Cryptomeria japonica TaxID=3369 RepID=UPI0025AC31A1|nr:uncharacterized protein LOC131040795 [Cryptomeria japonica]
MAFGGYNKFPRRDDGSPSGDKFENLEENPSYNLNTKDNKHGHDESLTTEEQEDRQLDENRVEEERGKGEVTRLTTPRQYNNRNGERRNNSGEITSNWNNRYSINNVSNTGGNHGNNENYGNNDNGNNRNGNNNNGGGNNGNNGNNGINRNYQITNYGCRPPMTIERYKQLDFSGIVGYPNQIANDLRSVVPKFTGNGTDSTEHVINVKNTIEEFEIPHEDVFMKLFVQYLIEDVGEWYRNLPDRCFAEEKDHENEYEPTVNILSSDPFWGRDEDSFEGEKSSDVQWRRENQQHSVQQVFTDDEADIPSLRRLFHNEDQVHSLRNLTDEEKKA